MENKGTLLNTWGALEEEFSTEQISAIQEIIQTHKNKPGSLIPALEDIQELVGYLPKSIQALVARGLGLSFSEVYGVVTFYHFFTMFPRGRHTCRVCLGTACYVRGGQKTLERLSGLLKIKPGETTEDRIFSLETVRCLGACGLAPTMMIDQETFPRVKSQKIKDILEDFTDGPTAAPVETPGPIVSPGIE